MLGTGAGNRGWISAPHLVIDHNMLEHYCTFSLNFFKTILTAHSPKTAVLSILWTEPQSLRVFQTLLEDINLRLSVLA